MKYYKQSYHYYLVNESDVLHVNTAHNIINRLTIDEFRLSTDEKFEEISFSEFRFEFEVILNRLLSIVKI